MQTRQEWASVPESLRARVDVALGSNVISAQSQSGGFSPGSADRVSTADGRRAFVKTLDGAVNPHGAELHRAEADILRRLPAGVASPRLLDFVEHDGWVAIIVEDVDGHAPTGDDIVAVLDVYAALPRADGPLETLPLLAEELAPDSGAWQRLSERGLLDTVGPWAAERHALLHEAASALPRVVDGDRLVHLDARADNVIITVDGPVIVDWPWATRGVGWFDAATYLIDARMRDSSLAIDTYLEHSVFDKATDADIDSVLAALAGSWFERAQEPAPPGMPTLRAFQRAEATACIDWLQARWG